MVKTASLSLLAHIAQDCTTLCTLWRLERADGTVMGFTDHDADIDYGGLIYVAATGYTRTALSGDASLSVDNMDLEGIVASGALTADDIRAGLYDWAELRVMLVNYADPTQGAILLRRGTLGEFTLRSGVFVTELRGLSQSLSRNFIESTSPDCRTDLGDERCKVDLSLHTETGTVTAITSPRRSFRATITGGRETGYFNGGLLIWDTGANAGARLEVREIVDDGVTLTLPLGEDIAEGDTFTLQAGCDKRLSTCIEKFDNVLNFRGEPFIPGIDAISKTPDAKPQ